MTRSEFEREKLLSQRWWCIYCHLLLSLSLAKVAYMKKKAGDMTYQSGPVTIVGFYFGEFTEIINKQHCTQFTDNSREELKSLSRSLARSLKMEQTIFNVVSYWNCVPQLDFGKFYEKCQQMSCLIDDVYFTVFHNERLTAVCCQWESPSFALVLEVAVFVC